MNGQNAAHTVSTLAIPVIALLALITLLRLSCIILDIADAEIAPSVRTASTSPEAADVKKPGKRENTDTGEHTRVHVSIKGLPSYTKKESMSYFLIKDYSKFSESIEKTSVGGVWNIPGFKEATQSVAQTIEESWKQFSVKYQFPLENIFKGFGPNVGTIEGVITDFALFRGMYSISLAVSCEIKGDKGDFKRTFIKNSSTVLKKKIINKTEVYQKDGKLGTLSVFFSGSYMYITAGKRMCENLIARLQGG